MMKRGKIKEKSAFFDAVWKQEEESAEHDAKMLRALEHISKTALGNKAREVTRWALLKLAKLEGKNDEKPSAR